MRNLTIGAALVGAFVVVSALSGVAPARAATPTGSADPALVVILDLSGSMKDEDDKGVVKLAAAKTSVERILRSQASKTATGVWGYPVGDNCDAGEFIVAPGTMAGVGELDRAVASVDSMSADGGTPTGKALQAVKDEMAKGGHTKASIVLVSDGESNCSSPPCPVAEQLSAAGFDVTVDAVGFQQSDAGREELECVANATGGRYFDAQNGDELKQRLDELTTAHLALDLTFAKTVQSGSSTYISVTIENPSALTAKDVRVNLSFMKDAGDAIMPAVLPPTFKVGNIGPHQRVTRKWAVTTGIRGDPGTGNFKVTGWAPDVPPVQASGSFRISSETPTTTDLGAVMKDVGGGDEPIVILGDSYSAGEGTFDYLPNPDGTGEDVCHRSMKTYFAPVMAAAPDRMKVLACSGAMTRDFYIPQHPGEQSGGARSQLDQLNDIAGAGAALMTLGGNDIGFASVIQQCLLLTECAPNLVQPQSEAVAALKPAAQMVFQDVWSELNEPEDVRARDGEYAPLIVLAYPKIVHESVYGGCGLLLSTFEVDFANRLVTALNASIKLAVAGARANGYEVYFASDTQQAFNPGHTVCDGNQSYVNHVIWPVGLTPTNDMSDPVLLYADLARSVESMHPTVDGYAEETVRLVGWMQTVERVLPDTSAIRKYEDRCLENFTATVYPSGKGSGSALTLNKANQSLSATSCGMPVHLTFKAEPFSTVLFELHSTPTLLGSAMADEDGMVDTIIWVPTDIEPGSHELVLKQTDLSGMEATETKVRLDVMPRAPFWVVAVAVATGTFFVGAAVLFIIGLVRRRRFSS